MLDIQIFRIDQGGNPDLVRESQRRRYPATDTKENKQKQDEEVKKVDDVIEVDTEWRKVRGALDNANKAKNQTQTEITQYYKRKEEVPPSLLEKKAAAEAEMAGLNPKLAELAAKRDAILCAIGNLVPDDVPVDDNEDNNLVVDTYGAFTRDEWMLSHYDLVGMAGLASTGADSEGSAVAGSRGYFLIGPGVRLNQALISYAIDFLTKRGMTMVQTPFFMNKDMMAKVAQLDDFDEQLYKVSAGEDKPDQYLIATSEQPLCGFHHKKSLEPKELPKRYAGYSTCFRKEAGGHGRDQLGIFRVHQFEKVEQFCVTSPHGDESWRMQEEMMANCKAFYQSLGVPYHVVNIVSGALNDAAAKKYDLEAWFPGSGAHRELVSCSNCTDYQARRLQCRYGMQGKTDDGKTPYVHMLNSTLTATERCLCCLIENYQTPCGIKVPAVLQEYMGGESFIPFTANGVKAFKDGWKLDKRNKGKPEPLQHVPTAAELAELVGKKQALQAYVDAEIAPALAELLNELARTKPDNPLDALAKMLAARVAADGAGAEPEARDK